MEPLIPLETFSCKTDTKCPVKGVNDADIFPSYLDEAKSAGSEGPVPGNKQRPTGDPAEIVQVATAQMPEKRGAGYIPGETDSSDDRSLAVVAAGQFPSGVSGVSGLRFIEDERLHAATAANEIFNGPPLLQMEKAYSRELNNPGLFSDTTMRTNPAVLLSPENRATASLLTDGITFPPAGARNDFVAYSANPQFLGGSLRFQKIGDNSFQSSQGDPASEVSASRFIDLLGKASHPPGKPLDDGYYNLANETADGTLPGEAEKTFLEITKHFLSKNNMDRTGDNIIVARQTNPAHDFHLPATFDTVLENLAAAQHLQDASQQGNQESATIRLPSGFQIPENRISDQIFEHLSIKSLKSSEGNSNLSIRMHPEELGHLELELVVNKDGVRAHIQAQTIQVRDILEKHIFRLREGFEQQGLNLQEVTVSVNSEQHHGPGHFQEQLTPRSPSFSLGPMMVRDAFESVPDEIITPNFRTDGSISLRI